MYTRYLCMIFKDSDFSPLAMYTIYLCMIFKDSDFRPLAMYTRYLCMIFKDSDLSPLAMYTRYLCMIFKDSDFRPLASSYTRYLCMIFKDSDFRPLAILDICAWYLKIQTLGLLLCTLDICAWCLKIQTLGLLLVATLDICAWCLKKYHELVTAWQQWLLLFADNLCKQFGTRSDLIGLIWVQAVWHSDRGPERTFWFFLKNQQTTKRACKIFQHAKS